MSNKILILIIELLQKFAPIIKFYLIRIYTLISGKQKAKRKIS